MSHYLDDLDFGEMPTPATKTLALKSDLAPLRGLVDVARAASILQLENPKRVSVWLSKKTKALAEGRTLAPLLAELPEPIGYMSGGAVFTEESIVAFGVAAGFIQRDDHAVTGKWISVEAEPVLAGEPASGSLPPLPSVNAYGPEDDELF